MTLKIFIITLICGCAMLCAIHAALGASCAHDKSERFAAALAAVKFDVAYLRHFADWPSFVRRLIYAYSSVIMLCYFLGIISAFL